MLFFLNNKKNIEQRVKIILICSKIYTTININVYYWADDGTYNLEQMFIPVLQIFSNPVYWKHENLTYVSHIAFVSRL